MGDQMKEKYYNRKSITYIMYTISFIFLLVGIIILPIICVICMVLG